MIRAPGPVTAPECLAVIDEEQSQERLDPGAPDGVRLTPHDPDFVTAIELAPKSTRAGGPPSMTLDGFVSGRRAHSERLPHGCDRLVRRCNRGIIGPC